MPAISRNASRRTVRTTAVRTRSTAERDALISQHLGLVHHVARTLARKLHDGVELDELVSAGTIGLVQAMESFDPRRGLSFSAGPSILR